MQRPETWHDEAACRALFEQFMPATVEALLHEVAPEGWGQSPLVRVYHPTPEQRYQEALDWYERPPLFGKEAAEDKGDPPRRKDFQEGDDQRPINPEREVLDIVGCCLWDIFSDNNEVVGPDGRAYHLGSFRGTGGFLARFFNERYAPGYRYGYMDFYMGVWTGGDRADLTPVALTSRPSTSGSSAGSMRWTAIGGTTSPSCVPCASTAMSQRRTTRPRTTRRRPCRTTSAARRRRAPTQRRTRRTSFRNRCAISTRKQRLARVRTRRRRSSKRMQTPTARGRTAGRPGNTEFG